MSPYEFLRLQPPDISRYLPKFTYDKSKSLKDILRVSSWEHEKQRQTLIDIEKQFFVETATWGLSDWERVVEVKPNPSDNYTQRRNRILLKLNGAQTSTVEFIKRLVARYVSDDTEISLTEFPAEYRFSLSLKNGLLLYTDDMIEAINLYKPAHLAFALDIIREYNMEGKDAIRLAAVISRDGQVFIDNAKPPNSISSIFAAAINTTIGTKEIDFNKLDKMMSSNMNFAALAMRDGVKRIEANREDIDRAKWDIKEPSCTFAKFANAILIEGERKIFSSTPPPSKDKFQIAAVSIKDGVKIIENAPPKDSESKTYAIGFTIKSGVKRIEANLDREPDADLEHSLSLPKVGAALQVEGLKRLFLSTPPASKAFSHFAAGLAKSGVIYIGANRETKRRRPHVGIMHAGRSL